MGLIVCPDCNSQVSDRADTCIHCGAPLRVAPPALPAQAPPLAGSVQAVQTVEMTGKKLKVQQALSGVSLAIGLLWMLGAAMAETFSPIGLLFTLAALGWVCVTSLRIWWNHK